MFNKIRVRKIRLANFNTYDQVKTSLSELEEELQEPTNHNSRSKALQVLTAPTI